MSNTTIKLINLRKYKFLINFKKSKQESSNQSNLNNLESKFKAKLTLSKIHAHEDEEEYSHNFNNEIRETQNRDIKKVYKVKDKEDRATVE